MANADQTEALMCSDLGRLLPDPAAQRPCRCIRKYGAPQQQRRLLQRPRDKPLVTHALKNNLPLGRRDESRDNTKQGRLASTRGSKNSQNRPLVGLKGKAPKNPAITEPHTQVPAL
jgi:hypothetical protein